MQLALLQYRSLCAEQVVFKAALFSVKDHHTKQLHIISVKCRHHESYGCNSKVFVGSSDFFEPCSSQDFNTCRQLHGMEIFTKNVSQYR
jgi:hypothetical protein